MATHMENAAGHLLSAMLAEPGSGDAIVHSCATVMFEHAATSARTRDQIQAADGKFRALRASGFTGPIDVNGDPVTDDHPLRPLLDAIRRGDSWA